jgi:hypothetical protein
MTAWTCGAQNLVVECSLISPRRHYWENAPGASSIASTVVKDQDVLQHLRSYNGRSTLTWLTEGPLRYFLSVGEPDNLMGLVPVVRERVNEDIQDGLAVDKAYKDAMEWVNKAYVRVNDSLVRTNGNVPTDFAPLAENILQDYFAKYGHDEGLDNWHDLTIRQSPGEAQWVIFNKRSRMPVHSGRPGERVITLRGLQRYRIHKAELEKEKPGALSNVWHWFTSGTDAPGALGD